ncbi:MAG: YbgC/FadM family acyl-CoA thioesterase [Campylobacterota bacterium]|nr:YbgC/FadM family acyl-CoA thioesterase [Campylobacterota bacterium]
MIDAMKSAVHYHDVRVYYEDVDLGGIVYHSMYLNFCERARSEIFFSVGRSPVEGEYHFVAKHIDADFVGSGKFGQTLQIQTTMRERKKASFLLRQEVFEVASMKKLFTMDIRLACMKGERVSAIPSGFLELFE